VDKRNSRVADAAAAAGIEPNIKILAADAKTAVAAAQQLGCEVGAINKAAPRFVLSATGQVIGGVAPTGHPSPLRR
jgi:prolyl-tRNA editing enzyme YbaK/EbsC (Cys-tRNA(Pro) deacylase)